MSRSCSSLSVVVLDIKTLLTRGVEDALITLKKLRLKKTPKIWCWIPPHPETKMYVNKHLHKADLVERWLVGEFTTAEYEAHEVLLWTTSVHIAHPIRKQNKAQTIVGDSLLVLERGDTASFSMEFSREFSKDEQEHLKTKVKSKIYDYLTTKPGVSVTQLNTDLWVQERAEGAAIVENGKKLVASSSESLKEWTEIFDHELKIKVEEEKIQLVENAHPKAVEQATTTPLPPVKKDAEQEAIEMAIKASLMAEESDHHVKESEELAMAMRLSLQEQEGQKTTVLGDTQVDLVD